ncbi:MAG TPA: KipI antagonist [Syntrophus sp. (in: bacteria)]|nr:KipI antagonist [Syntrophus sp. (in: bacteria)]
MLVRETLEALFKGVFVEVWEVIHPGILTTIQDRGRYGYQQYGVSVSGAMDKFALRLANMLAGNDDGEAALEMTIVGPKLRALRACRIAIAGADLSPQINGRPLATWQPTEMQEGDVLSFGTARSGCRAYLAVYGGIEAPLTMGSRSTHILSKLGGLNGRALIKGDRISIRNAGGDLRRFNPDFSLRREQIPSYGREWQVRVIPGPQSDYFTRRGIAAFYSAEYDISPQADRMGYRLRGPKIEHKAAADILTDATPRGSVQVPGDGNPIILLSDGQTTGGYSKIGVIISPDQDRLGQARPGDKIRFRRMGVVEAQRIIQGEEERIQEIKRASLITI